MKFKTSRVRGFKALDDDEADALARWALVVVGTPWGQVFHLWEHSGVRSFIYSFARLLARRREAGAPSGPWRRSG